jgi:hypothetical protein
MVNRCFRVSLLAVIAELQARFDHLAGVPQS